MRVYLVGFMGAGKTSVGKCMALRLGYAFLDLDTRIESVSGMRVQTIFRRHGEARFRALERRELARTVAGERIIVATGGGTMACPENRRVMCGRGSLSVWLDPDLEAIEKRLARSDPALRPLIGTAESRQRLFRQRLDAYRLADCHIKIVMEESVEDVADRVLHKLRELSCVI